MRTPCLFGHSPLNCGQLLEFVNLKTVPARHYKHYKIILSQNPEMRINLITFTTGPKSVHIKGFRCSALPD